MAKNKLQNLFYKIHDFIFSLFSGKTVGVRTMLIHNNKILLVKHSYRRFWYMPGGAVDNNESPIAAAKREVFEETNIKCDNLELFGFYYSKQKNHDDYTALYIANLDEETEFKADGKEISEIKLYRFDDLPQDISPATKRRIDEYLNRTKKSDLW